MFGSGFSIWFAEDYCVRCFFCRNYPPDRLIFGIIGSELLGLSFSEKLLGSPLKLLDLSDNPRLFPFFRVLWFLFVLVMLNKGLFLVGVESWNDKGGKSWATLQLGATL